MRKADIEDMGLKDSKKNNTREDQIMLNKVPLENVKDYNYLGSIKTHMEHAQREEVRRC